MALPVQITGAENIDQGGELTLTAVVTGPGTFQYAWSASRGSFVGATNEASAVYRADFTDTSDIPVTVTCRVTRPANASPTVPSGSLTAMTQLGITGQILNMFLNPTADTAATGRSNIHPGGTLVSGSDDTLSSNIRIAQIEWNNNTNRIILTKQSGGGDMGAFWQGNTTQSIYVIFSDGTVLELDDDDLAVTTTDRAQWNVTNTTLQQKFVDLDGVKSLLVGVANSDSIGLEADTGSATATFTAAAAPIDALTVSITDTTEIEQGGRVTLTAVVTDANGNVITSGLAYAWSANRGSFVGATDEASAVYHADFIETVDVPVMVTCGVTRVANASPTVSAGSLTAMEALGITGRILNMYLSPAGSVSPNANNNLYQSGTTGTLAANSDAVLASNLTINRIRWNNSANRFILNSSGGGNLNSFWSGNTTQSIFLIFDDGTFIEIPNSAFAAGGNTWAQFNITDTDIIALLDAFDGTDNLLVGVGNKGSTGWNAGSGSDVEMFTAVAVTPLSVEAIDAQNIPVLTENYELEIDIGGEPERAYVDGDMEGFYHTWSASDAKIRIKSEAVTRLISDAIWNVHLVKGTRTLDAEIIYNVVPSAPVIADPGQQDLIRDIEFSLDIGIANKPTVARGSGLLTGLKYGPREDGEEGLNIAGKLPRDAGLTESTFNAAIYAENNGGADTVDVPFNILLPVFYGAKFGNATQNTTIYRFQLNGNGNDISSDLSFTISSTFSATNTVSMAIDADYIYFHYNNQRVYRVARNTGDGQSVTPTELFFDGHIFPKGLSVDANYLYVSHHFAGRGDIFRRNKSDGSADARLILGTSNGHPLGTAFHGSNFVALDNVDDRLYFYSISGTTVTAVKSIGLPTGIYRDIDIIGDVIYVTERSHKIHAVDATLADGTTLTAFEATYNVPSAMRELEGIGIILE